MKEKMVIITDEKISAEDYVITGDSLEEIEKEFQDMLLEIWGITNKSIRDYEHISILDEYDIEKLFYDKNMLTPIYIVLDEQGHNVGNAKIRQIYGTDYYIYVDENQGWSIVSMELIQYLNLVKEEDYEDPEE